MIPDTRLVIVEGMMGVGKSTMVRFLVRQLTRSGFPAQRFTRGVASRTRDRNRLGRTSLADIIAPTATRRNPTQITGRLLNRSAEPTVFWDGRDVDHILRRSDRRWKAFARGAQRSATINVFDGDLFNGDLTTLMLLGAPLGTLRGFVRAVEENAGPMNPVLIYLRPVSVRAGLDRIVALRGPQWLKNQMSWKLSAPYCRRRGLQSIEGWIELYERYRDLCDRLFADLTIPKLRLEVTANSWWETEEAILSYLGMCRRPDPLFRVWNATRRTVEVTRVRGETAHRGVPGTAE